MRKEFLNDIEKEELVKFADNTTMFHAVKKVLLAQVYFEGVLEEGTPELESTQNFALTKAIAAIQQSPSITNDMLGEQLRSDVQALRQVELAWQSLASYKSKPTEVVEDSEEHR